MRRVLVGWRFDALIAPAVALALLLAGCAAEVAAVPAIAAVATAAPEVVAPIVTAAALDEPSPPRVVLAAVGDLMFARDVVDAMERHGTAYPFARALPLFEGAELLVGNLEGTFTDRGVAQQKRYTFRAPPALARGLAEAGFDAVALANNHAVDFGSVSLLDTLAATEAAGVATFGAGPSAEQAYAPRVVRAPSASVALLAFNAIPGSPPAGEGSPGVAWANAAALASVSRARLEADFVVVFVHWGVEYSGTPQAEQRAFGRAAIEAGASAVVGTHPHALQPWERHRGGVILYSLGNFVFDLDAEDFATLGEGPFATAVAVLTLEAGRPPEVELRPAYIDAVENRPRPASVQEAARIGVVLRELPRSE